MISKDPMGFYWFNDSYFMGIVHQKFVDGSLDSRPDIKDMAKTLLLRTGAQAVKGPEFKQILLNQDDDKTNEKVYKKAESKFSEIKNCILQKGTAEDWVLPDLPEKKIIFVKSPKKIAESGASINLLLERDPVKISYPNGEVKLLADVENSIISKLSNSMSYTPNVFCSDGAYDLLMKEGVISED